MVVFFNSLIESGFLYFFFISVILAAGLAIIGSKLFIKHSLLRKFSIIITIVALLDAQMAYIIGMFGLIHLVWAVPASLILLIIFIRIIKKDFTVIEAITDNITKLSNYDLNITTNKQHALRNDEFGILTQSLETMANNMTELVNQIYDSSSLLQQSNNQLSTSSTEISQSTNEQAANVEEISSSVEEMVATIDHNTQNLQTTEQYANKVEKSIDQTQKASSANKKNMNKISEKIHVINEIAQKTDLLAINAAIEAAHAGEQGKGFAVVASEIRKLSENTQDAAKEIIHLTENSVKSTDLADTTLNQIIPDINEIVKRIINITEASTEQSKTGAQINLSVQEFNSSIQQNTASVSEVTTSVELLTQKNKNLQETIQKFNRRKNNI